MHTAFPVWQYDIGIFQRLDHSSAHLIVDGESYDVIHQPTLKTIWFSEMMSARTSRKSVSRRWFAP